MNEFLIALWAFKWHLCICAGAFFLVYAACGGSRADTYTEGETNDA